MQLRSRVDVGYRSVLEEMPPRRFRRAVHIATPTIVKDAESRDDGGELTRAQASIHSECTREEKSGGKPALEPRNY